MAHNKNKGGREAKKPKKDKKAKAPTIRTSVIPQPEHHHSTQASSGDSGASAG